MKIDRLYTLSQFIDKLYYDGTINLETFYYSIGKYNEFLKQPLQKEMFVNEIEEPTLYHHNIDRKYYNNMLKVWQEAEKKVIFEDVDLKQISFEWETIKVLYPTLSDLAEAYSGKLKLKNIEI
jgi:hypothetical protein